MSTFVMTIPDLFKELRNTFKFCNKYNLRLCNWILSDSMLVKKDKILSKFYCVSKESY